MGKSKKEENNSDCDIIFDDIKITKINNGSYGIVYLIENLHENNDKKYIFKFTLSMYDETIKYKGKKIKFKKPGKCEYKIINALKDFDEIPKICYFKNDIEIKDKYIKYFEDIEKLLKDKEKRKVKDIQMNLMITKYINGVSLMEYVDYVINTDKYTNIEIIHFFDEICTNFLNTIEKIYNKMPGFFHGDLHPNNILISEDRKINFIDFGFSCDLNSKKPKISLELFKNNKSFSEICVNDTESKDELTLNINKIRFLRCYDIILPIAFLMNSLVRSELLREEYVKEIKNKFFKKYYEEILKFTFYEDGINKNPSTFNIEYYYNLSIFSIITGYINSIFYKLAYSDLDFIKNINWE